MAQVHYRVVQEQQNSATRNIMNRNNRAVSEAADVVCSTCLNNVCYNSMVLLYDSFGSFNPK